MSVFREDKPLSDDEKFTVKDYYIIAKLLKTKKLTERQKQAVQRLYRTYQYMVD